MKETLLRHSIFDPLTIRQEKVKITFVFHEGWYGLEDISFMLNQVVYKEKRIKILREILKTEF